MDKNKVTNESYETPDKLENDIIVGYNEDTGFYDCSINGKLVVVDKYGNYFDEEGNPKQVDGWKGVKKEYHRHNPQKTALTNIIKISGPVIGTVIEGSESKQGNGGDNNGQGVDGEVKKIDNGVIEGDVGGDVEEDPNLDELYKDNPEDYDSTRQYLNNR